MKQLLMVCHGNICRSPMAEFVMRALVHRAGLEKEIQVDSKACRTDEIGNDMHEGTKRVLRAHGISFSKRAARQIRDEDYVRYDLILAMDEENMRDLRRRFHGDPQGKCHLLLLYVGENREVGDPWYTGDFDATYRDVVRGCKALLHTLQEDGKK